MYVKLVILVGTYPVGARVSRDVPVGSKVGIGFGVPGETGRPSGNLPKYSLNKVIISLLQSHALIASAITKRDFSISSRYFLRAAMVVAAEVSM